MSIPAIEQLEEQLLTHTPPQDETAEQAVLASMLRHNEQIPEIRLVVQAADFYDPKHRVLFRAITDEYHYNGAVKSASLLSLLKGVKELESAGGHGYLESLHVNTADASIGPIYAKRVAQASTLRRILEFHAQAAREIAGGTVDRLDEVIARQKAAFEALAAQSQDNKLQRVSAVAKETWEINARPKDFAPPITTHLPLLDEALDGGLRPGNMFVIAGETSHGKTTHGLCLLREACFRQKRRSLLVTLEMSADEVTAALMAGWVDADYHCVARSAKAGEAQLSANALCGVRAFHIADYPLDICDTTATPDDVALWCARAKASGRPYDLVVVDHIHIMPPPRGQRYDGTERVFAAVAEGLKGVSRDYRVAMVAMAQLNRKPGESDQEPHLRHIKYSGAIEQIATTVVMPWIRPGEFGEEYMLFGRKNRFGERIFELTNLNWEKGKWRIS